MLVVFTIFFALLGGPNIPFHANGVGGSSFHGASAAALDVTPGGPSATSYDVGSGGPSVTAPLDDVGSGGPSVTGFH